MGSNSPKGGRRDRSALRADIFSLRWNIILGVNFHIDSFTRDNIQAFGQSYLFGAPLSTTDRVTVSSLRRKKAFTSEPGQSTLNFCFSDQQI